MRADFELPWSEFKTQILDSGHYSWMHFEQYETLIIFAKQNNFSILCKIPTSDTASITEYETEYEAGANRPLKSRVVTEFEVDDKTLKLAHISGNIDGSGDCVLSILIPGSFDPDVPSRYIAGGYAFTDAFGWGDRITKVELVDEDNILGFGAGTTIGSYHDESVDAANSGWLFWRGNYDGTNCEGECEVEPIGGFGKLYGGMYLKITYKRATGNPATKLAVNLWWAVLG